jgi:hypothetical protein
MKKKAALVAALAIQSLMSSPAAAQHAPWEEYHKKIASSSTIVPLSDNLFHENVDLYNGTTSFKHVDIDIPGNSALPVRVERSFSASDSPSLMMGDWDLNVPHLGGVFASAVSGVSHPSYNWPGQRCSGPRMPPIADSAYWPIEYWHGLHANLPEGGELLEPASGVLMPSGGPYRWVTSGNTWFSCLSTVRNGAGEGFLAITPDGTKYWFDWLSMTGDEMLERYMPNGGAPGQVAAVNLSRNRVLLHATRAEDRFGNWVTYTYSNSATAPPRLDKIESNDGRTIDFTYNASGYIASISAAGKTWLYEYAPHGMTRVVLPDSSSWSFSLLGAKQKLYGVEEATCSNTGFSVDPVQPVIGTMVHPSGAIGQFVFELRLHGRSNVPKNCLSTGEELAGHPEAGTYSDFVRMYWTRSLVRKKISGPGILPMQWDFKYNNSLKEQDITSASLPGPGSWAAATYSGSPDPVCVSDTCAGVVTTEVFGPAGGWTRYTYGNSYRYNEHKLLKQERGTGPGNILRTEVVAYELNRAGLPFPARFGTSTQYKGDSFTESFLSPLRSKTITQDGVVFRQTVNSFDSLGRPLSVTKSSSPTP